MTETIENWYGEETATLGDRLVFAREAAGLSAQDLAGRLGVKVETLDAWENDRKEPRANRLQTLTGLLGVSLRWLLTGVGEGPDSPEAEAPAPEDVREIVMEMRKIQSQIAKSAIRLGELEKQLRKSMVAS